MNNEAIDRIKLIIDTGLECNLPTQAIAYSILCDEAMKKSKHNPNTCEIIGCNECIEYLKAKESEDECCTAIPPTQGVHYDKDPEEKCQHEYSNYYDGKYNKIIRCIYCRELDPIRQVYEKWKDSDFAEEYLNCETRPVIEIWNVIKKYCEED